jgi:NAD-dependent deacetylase
LNYQERISRLAEILTAARNAYVLTGAGISTESGIPDFRSPQTGLWTKVDPMKKATVSFLNNDPDEFWRMNLSRYRQIAENARPNMGHKVLARLEESGFIGGIITQNIDGLHHKAGSKKVWELHGHVRTVRCLLCRHEEDFSFAVQEVENKKSAPRCPKCGGIIRPNVVLFEDPMDDSFSQVMRLLPKADLLLIAGTSLQVYPVASLPELVDNLVIINMEPTHMDSRAKLVIHEKTGRVLEDLLIELKAKGKLS